MKHCLLCDRDEDSAGMVAVIPATWNRFNNFAEVCEPCRQTRKFQTWARSAARTSLKASVLADAAPHRDLAAEAAGPTQVEITHRQTGALLHTVIAKSLEGSSLPLAMLSSANLRHAGLRGANLKGADLHLADLTGADLRATDLRTANLRGADLRGADLRESRLQRADLRNSLYDDDTHWPVGFQLHGLGAEAGPRRRL